MKRECVILSEACHSGAVGDRIRRSRKIQTGVFLAITFLLSACTDYLDEFKDEYDDTFTAVEESSSSDDEVSSSEESDEESSSSKKATSSSSEKKDESSSSAKEDSSSSKKDESSSSKKEESSSSKKEESSSSKKVESSSSVKDESSSSSSVKEVAGLGTCAPSVATTERGMPVEWKFTKGAWVNATTVMSAKFEWVFEGGTPSTAEQKGRFSSGSVTYSTSGPKAAMVTIISAEGTEVIECSTLQVTGDPITGCKCEGTNISPDVSMGESAKWTVTGCTSASNIISYTWTGATADGTGWIATAPVSAKGEVVSGVSVTVSNTDNTSLVVACPDAKAIDSSVPDNVFTDDRDGKTYKTVVIGSQTWMAENLKYESANSYCYGGDTANCTKYGRLYTWAIAMDSAGTWSENGKGCGYGETCTPTSPVRGVCPKGWHIPSKGEISVLYDNVGGENVAGKMLKSTSGWSESGNGTDSFGFNALPSGYKDGETGEYVYGGSIENFWCIDQPDNDNRSRHAYHLHLSFAHDTAFVFYDLKTREQSVRCIKD